jgi:hypothetical protein
MILRIPWAFLIFSSLEKENKNKNYKFFTILGLAMCPIFLHIYLAWNVKALWTVSTRDKRINFETIAKI